MPKRPILLLSLSSIVLSSAFALWQAVPASAATTVLQDGIRQFQAGRWVLAQGPLERAVSKNPRDLTAHYYLANCYVHLKRHEDAIREFNTAYSLDPYGPLSGYCRRALVGYGRQIPGDMTAMGNPPGAVSVPRAIASLPVAQIPTMSSNGATPQYNSNDSISKAVDTIRKQADVEKGRHKTNSDVFGADAAKTGEGSARRIIEDADDECRRIMEAPLPNILGGIGSSMAMEQQRELERRQRLCEEIRKKAANDAARARAEAADRTQKFQQFSRDRQAALDEVAGSLESQLVSSRIKDRVKLRAEGTGLYVRNFGVLSTPAPDVHNSVARIHPREPVDNREPIVEGDGGGDADKLQGPEGESAGETGKLTPTVPPAPPQRNVSGKVLDAPDEAPKQ